MIQIITKLKEGLFSKFQIEHFINEYTTRASAFFLSNAARGAPPGTLACVDMYIKLFFEITTYFHKQEVRITLIIITIYSFCHNHINRYCDALHFTA